MNLQEVKIECIKKGVTLTWLAQQLGYSTQYMYYCIKENKEKEVNRIKKILENN